MKKRVIFLSAVAALSLVVLLILLYIKKSPFSSSDLFECRRDRDCTVVSTVCGDWKAVNKAHMKNLPENKLKERGISPICMPDLPSEPKPDVACTQNVCVLERK